MVRPVSATRRRLPGGSFIWPYTMATLEFGQIVLVDDARLDHLVVEVVALAGALAHAGKHGQTTVLLGDVVDELEHVHGLADAGAAEQADLAALGERHQQVDDLDAGDQQILAAGLLVICRRGTVNGQIFRGLHRAFFVLRLAQHVHDAPQSARAHRYRNSLARALDGEAAAQTLGWAHGDGAHDAVAQLLLHLEGQVHIVELERVIDLGDLIAWKFHIDDRADDLHDFAAGFILLNLFSWPSATFQRGCCATPNI